MSCYTENTTVVFTPCLAERGFLLVFINLNMQFIIFRKFSMSILIIWIAIAEDGSDSNSTEYMEFFR